jgi:hypothetical protein
MEENVNTATPYVIKNFSGMNMTVKTMFGANQKYFLRNGFSTKVSIVEKSMIPEFTQEDGDMDYTDMQNKDSVDDNILLQFEECSSTKNKLIPLNVVATGIYKMNDQDDFFVLYYSISLQDMTKVMIVRTTNLIVNSTSYTYIFRIRN